MKKIEIKNKKTEPKVIDASGRTLGRLASEAAIHLSGKNKPSFERNVWTGAPVRIINAGKLSITAKKLDIMYHTRYSGMPGGLRILKGSETMEKKGGKELVRLAVRKMLPDNKLRKTMMKNLTIEN